MTDFNPALGFLWHAGEKGCFSPNTGRVEMTREEAERHNQQLDALSREAMAATGRAVLYLTKREGRWTITNFTGTLSLSPLCVKRGEHNIACCRYDAWFVFGGFVWHGVNIGDNELLRCKRTREKAKGVSC